MVYWFEFGKSFALSIVSLIIKPNNFFICSPP